MHYAALTGRSDVVHVLLASGGDPTRRSREGVTPLDVARAENASAVVRQLTRAYAAIDGLDLSWGVVLEGELQAKRTAGLALWRWRAKHATLSRPYRCLLLWSGSETRIESSVTRIPLGPGCVVALEGKAPTRRFTIRPSATPTVITGAKTGPAGAGVPAAGGGGSAASSRSATPTGTPPGSPAPPSGPSRKPSTVVGVTAAEGAAAEAAGSGGAGGNADAIELAASSPEDAALWVAAITALIAEAAEAESRAALTLELMRQEGAHFASVVFAQPPPPAALPAGVASAAAGAAVANGTADASSKRPPPPPSRVSTVSPPPAPPRTDATAPSASPPPGTARSSRGSGSSVGSKTGGGAVGASSSAPPATNGGGTGGVAARQARGSGTTVSAAPLPPRGGGGGGAGSAGGSSASRAAAAAAAAAATTTTAAVPPVGLRGKALLALLSDTKAPAERRNAAAAALFQRVYRGRLARKLTAGWVRVVDPSDGDIYWYNTLTEVSSWVPPGYVAIEAPGGGGGGGGGAVAAGGGEGSGGGAH
jgi:hypothetical protein